MADLESECNNAEKKKMSFDFLSHVAVVRFGFFHNNSGHGECS